MNVRYTARMQFRPDDDANVLIRETLELCRRGQIDEVMFFAFAEEQNDGHDSLERIRHWMDAIRPCKQALKAKGVEVSLNPWHSILHTDRGRRFKPDQTWQPLMDWRGRAASAMVCPLDPDWRVYYASAMRLFAAERFRVIWIDDDIRYHNHAPLDWGGCWCPLHIAEFNRRACVQASREDIVGRILKPGEPHPWRAVWLDMWDDLHIQLIDSWRVIVELEGSRLGLMSSSVEAHAMEGRNWDKWWDALSGARPPVHRPHFWGYSEAQGPMLVYGISQLQQHHALRRSHMESAPEIECFPYGPWNKSFRHTFAQMALAQIFGAHRLAISLFDFMGNLPSDEPERAEFLARVKPALSWLGEQFSSEWAPYGVGIPWDPDLSRRVQTTAADNWRALEVTTRGWEQWLGPFGVAFQKRPHSAVNALAGNMAAAYDDDTLRQFLSSGLLLDGPAAATLIARGCGELIGLSDPRIVSQDDLLYSAEESLDAEFGLRPGAQMSLNAEKPYAERLLQARLLPGARNASVLRDPVQRALGHGAVLFENALGGRVAIMPWDANAGTNLCTQRQAQIIKVLRWLARDARVASVEGGAWLVAQFFSAGSRWRGVVWNASPDVVRRIRIMPPPGMDSISNAMLCSADGVWSPVPVLDNIIDLPTAMHQWEFLILNPE